MFKLTVRSQVIGYADHQDSAERIAASHSKASTEFAVYIHEFALGQYRWAATFTAGRLTEQRHGGGYRNVRGY